VGKRDIGYTLNTFNVQVGFIIKRTGKSCIMGELPYLCLGFFKIKIDKITYPNMVNRFSL
jgi:hypothetical protein